MEKVINNKGNKEKCICPNCPSYNECAKEKKEVLFCADKIGKGKCAYQMNGCICGMCPVHKECKLKNGYYCIHGSAKEIDSK